MYMCTYSSQYRDAGRTKQKMGQQWMPRAKEVIPLAILGTRAIGSSALT